MSNPIQQCQSILLAYFSTCGSQTRISHYDIAKISKKAGTQSICDQDIIDASASMPTLWQTDGGYVCLKGTVKDVYDVARRIGINGHVFNAVKDFHSNTR